MTDSPFVSGMGTTYTGPTTTATDSSSTGAIDPNSPSAVQAQADAAAAALQSQADTAAAARAAQDYANQLALIEAQRKYEQDQLIKTIQTAFKEYGLESLYSKITEYVRKGYSGEAVALLLRDTPEYQARFPAMAALSSKNRAITEGQYIEFERNAAQLERAYGLPAGMLGKDAVTNLLTHEVSAKELEDRVVMAATAAYNVKQDVRDTFENYYGIGGGGLTAYFLDPDVATPLLNKQFVSSQIGAEAARQSIGIDVALAQDLQEAGINAASAQEGFTKVATQRGLTAGRGDVTTEGELINANLKGTAAAQSNVERVAASRVGRFSGGGDYLTNNGVSGLGSAAT